MSGWLCIWPIAALLQAPCPAESAPDLPARYGIQQSTVYRDVVEQAIIHVNAMVPADMELRLRLTWPASGYFPRLYFETDRTAPGFTFALVTDQIFDNGWRFRNAKEIPVYIVDGARLGRVENVFVPEGERCIFVTGRSLDRMFESMFLIGENALQHHTAYDKSLALALILLHELGHIKFGDGGSYGPPARLDLDELNRPSHMIENRELRADRFAFELVEQAWDSGEKTHPLGNLYARSRIAGQIYRVIATGSNSHDFRVDPRGLLDKIEKLEVFKASGYSHLNLYLRLLVMLHQLEPTDDRLAELQAIDKMFRTHRPKPAE